MTRKLEWVLVVLSRTSCAVISLFPLDMGKGCSRWVDVCRMLGTGDLWHSKSAVANFKKARATLVPGGETAGCGIAWDLPWMYSITCPKAIG